MYKVLTTTVLALSLSLLATAATITAETRRAADPAPDPTATGPVIMQGPGITDEGAKAMREFMQSPKAPQTMATMMEMARRMGNGDLMLGMTKMMDMMGGQGGMMGGQSGMMR